MLVCVPLISIKKARPIHMKTGESALVCENITAVPAEGSGSSLRGTEAKLMFSSVFYSERTHLYLKKKRKTGKGHFKLTFLSRGLIF